MRYRTLGNTGLTVSEIGFGTWGIGGVAEGTLSYGPTDDRESLQALQRALEVGITFYDTADLYGKGHAEELIGRAFTGRRDRVVIAGKVGFITADQPQVFTSEHIRASLEGTLRRIGSDYLDLYQLHSPPIDILGEKPEIVETLRALQREGKIRAWGISLRSPADGFAAIRDLGAAAIQVNFNMIDQRALNAGLFDLARERSVGVIVRTPFNYGFLTGKYSGTKFDPRDHRSQQPPERLEKWARAPQLFAPLNEGKARTIAELALQFCLVPPSVSTVIPGMLKISEVEENVKVASLPPLAPEEVSAIREIYRTSEFFG